MTATIESTFLAALKTGPVLLLDNMEDKTHAATNDPLVESSPLIRLAILAVDLGADPEMLQFNRDRFDVNLGTFKAHAAVVYNVGADCSELDRALRSGVPTIGFHYCSLERMYFLDEFGAYGQRIKAHRAKDGNENVRDPIVWIDPMPARFDRTLKHHMRVAELVKAHFERQGWPTAAKRLAACMEAAEATPVDLGAGVTANQEQAPELVIAEVEGGRSITLRGCSMPFANKDHRFEQGDPYMSGTWVGQQMVGGSIPDLHGFDFKDFAQLKADVGPNPATLVLAFFLILRSGKQLKVRRGSTVRYGILYAFEPAFHQLDRVDWRMQFHWSDDAAVAPESRPRAEISVPQDGRPMLIDDEAKRRAEQWQAIATLVHSYGHDKGDAATLPEYVRRVIEQLQHWRAFATHQGRRTGAKIPQGGELSAEQAVEHFDLFINVARSNAEELQRVRDLVFDRSHRMRSAASSALGLLDVIRGLIADAHAPSVDSGDMADLRARAEKAEAALAAAHPSPDATELEALIKNDEPDCPDAMM